MEIIFDIGIHTAKGILYFMYFTMDPEVGNVTVKQKNSQYTIHTVHEKLGHLNEDLTRKTAKQLSWEIPKAHWECVKPVQLAKQ